MRPLCFLLIYAVPFSALLRQSLERSQPGDSIVRKLYTLIMECHRRLGQPAEALAVCEQGRRYYPQDEQLLFQEALLRQQQGDCGAAEACLQRLLATEEQPHFASVAEGLRGHQARHQLAVVYREQGRLAAAEIQWRKAVEERPDFTPAWLDLAELYLGQQRWDALEEVCGALQTGSEGTAEAATFRARGYLARKEFAAARTLLEETIAHSPSALLPRVALSHVLLQEGRDWDAAESALRAVLALAPNHQEASNNLAVLLRKHGPGSCPATCK